jgi:hypothetical protein
MAETPTSLFSSQKKITTPIASATHGSNPQLFRLLNSAHHLLNSTNPSLAEDCRLCLSPSLPQVLATPLDSLEVSPGNKLNPPLTKPNITNIEQTHPAPQCLQSLQGSIPLGEVSKNLCINITQSTNNTQCLFSPGTYFVCGTATYICLPPGWKGTYTKVVLTPQIDVVPGNQSLPIPLEAYTRSKRAVQIIPLLIVPGITAGIGTDFGSIPLSIYAYQKL